MTRGETQVLEIVKVPDPVLRQKAKPVKKVTRSTRLLLDRMKATMYDADGVGLAAPQVGVLQRIIVVDVGDGPVELINPEILSLEGSETAFEGCLSIPGYMGEVERAKEIRVTGLDRNGHKIWIDAADFFARALQHEVDHLEGVLYIDKAKRIIELPPETQLRIVFMGTPEFAAVILEKMIEHGCRPVAVITQPDRPRGRGGKVTPSPVKMLAAGNRLPVLQPESLQDPEFLERVDDLDPDVIVTAAYGKILPEALLRMPRLAAVNVHASLLPRYRGAAPIQRALLDGREQTGVTILHMVSELDAGDIIVQKAVDISPDDNAGTLHDRLAEAGGSTLLEALRLIAKEEAPRIPQQIDQVTYAPKIQPEEEWIDWSHDAAAVANRIRALSPGPGAKTRLQNQVVAITKVLVEPGPDSGHALPGTIVSIGDGGIVVACGSGTVRILELKPAGGKRMKAHDFLNGHRVNEGERFA